MPNETAGRAVTTAPVDRFDSAGLQLDSLRRSNASAVAETILSHGPLSRAELSAKIGLSGSAVTKITAELRRAGLIVEGQVRTGDRDPGRPRVPISIDSSTYRFAGVHIGLRRSTVGLIDLAGDVVAQRAVEHRRKDPDSVLREARELLAEAGREAGGKVIGVGLCSGGWVDAETGIVRDHSVLGWRDVALSPAAGWTGVPLVFDSSVRALALAEIRFGAARGVGNALYVVIGNIVGVAHVVNGRVNPGRNSAAGTIDHLPVGPRSGITCSCGRRDCLWSLASDVAVVERAREAGLISKRGQLEEVIALAARQSGATPPAQVRAAAKLLRDRAAYAGVAVGLLVDLLAPEVVVLGGGLLQTPEHLDVLRAAATERAPYDPDTAARIRPTELGPDALVRGAATLALDAFYRDPLAMPAPVAGVPVPG